MSWAECASCGEKFTSDSAFDAHLGHPDSETDCYPPATLTKKDKTPLLIQVERKDGLYWGLNTPRPETLRFAGRGRTAASESIGGGNA